MKFLFVAICVISAVAIVSAQTFGRGQPPRGHMQGHMQGQGQVKNVDNLKLISELDVIPNK